MTISIVYLLPKVHTISSKDRGVMNIFLPIQLIQRTRVSIFDTFPTVRLLSQFKVRWPIVAVTYTYFYIQFPTICHGESKYLLQLELLYHPSAT